MEKEFEEFIKNLKDKLELGEEDYNSDHEEMAKFFFAAGWHCALAVKKVKVFQCPTCQDYFEYDDATDKAYFCPSCKNKGYTCCPILQVVEVLEDSIEVEEVESDDFYAQEVISEVN